MRGLYAIVDVSTLTRLGLPVLAVANAVAAARPAALQIRAKDLAPLEMVQLLRALHPICREFSVPLFANDRADLAVLAGCEGVHVGQDDMPIAAIRRMAPTLRIGVSTHNMDQMRRAMEDKPDYVAVGPVFATRSKPDSEAVVGLDMLRAIAANCPVPVVAIGGIDLSRAPEIARATRLGAVIAGLLPDQLRADDLAPVTERARALHAALRGA